MPGLCPAMCPLTNGLFCPSGNASARQSAITLQAHNIYVMHVTLLRRLPHVLKVFTPHSPSLPRQGASIWLSQQCDPLLNHGSFSSLGSTDVPGSLCQPLFHYEAGRAQHSPAFCMRPRESCLRPGNAKELRCILQTYSYIIVEFSFTLKAREVLL